VLRDELVGGGLPQRAVAVDEGIEGRRGIG